MIFGVDDSRFSISHLITNGRVPHAQGGSVARRDCVLMKAAGALAVVRIVAIHGIQSMVSRQVSLVMSSRWIRACRAPRRESRAEGRAKSGPVLRPGLQAGPGQSMAQSKNSMAASRRPSPTRTRRAPSGALAGARLFLGTYRSNASNPAHRLLGKLAKVN
jgi:hypothetical protein